MLSRSPRHFCPGSTQDEPATRPPIYRDEPATRPPISGPQQIFIKDSCGKSMTFEVISIANKTTPPRLQHTIPMLKRLQRKNYRRAAFVERHASAIAAYDKVVRDWECNKRIFWPACDSALQHALANRETRPTLAFLDQMMPEIVKTCVDCPWANVVKDVDTVKDGTRMFARILHSCLEICLGTVQQGSIDMMPLLTMLLDPTAQLYSNHNTHCPPSQTLLPSLKHHACSLGGPAQVLARLQNLPWKSVLPGVRFLRMCHEDGTHVIVFGQALGVLKQRILALGIDEEGTALASLEHAQMVKFWLSTTKTSVPFERPRPIWPDESAAAESPKKRAKMSTVPAPPPGYWITKSNIDATRSIPVLPLFGWCPRSMSTSLPPDLPDTCEFDVVRTNFMRGKLEYLFNKCAKHIDGCGHECTPFCDVQVVQVDRVENHPLWKRYAVGRASQPKQCGKIWVEESRPIDFRVDVGGDDEQFLFHGTSPNAISKIIVDGFRMGANDKLRYGRGIYFTDQSCKAHQYSDKKFVLQKDGSKLFCMLYCRVATRKALDFSVTDAFRKKRFLERMIKPTTDDPVFCSQFSYLFSNRLAFESLVVLPDEEHQMHREVIVYDSDQVYPEYVVWYKIESEKKTSVNVHGHEQLNASSQKCRADALSYARQKYAVAEALALQKNSEVSQLGVGPGLRQGWDDMPRGCVFSEVPIFSIHSAIPGGREAAGVLAEAFPTCIDGPFPSHAQALAGIEERSNYKVVEIVRVQNISWASMHDAFKRMYSIENTRTVYHGTTGASATTISKTGFRKACSQRSKFGKGIYTSSNIWEALAYAEPAPDLTQTFLVVNLLQGPTTLGQVEMVDFGSDAAGNLILTATNPENTIFCASHGDQLLATYRVSVRFDSSTKHTPVQQNLIRMYHPTIWELIKKQTLPLPPTAPLFLLPNTSTPFTTVATAPLPLARTRH